MKTKAIGFALLVATAGTGCKDAELALDNIVGTWNSTSINFSVQPGGTPTIDLAPLGFGWKWTVEATGDYTLVMSYPDTLQLSPDTITATVTVLPGNVIQMASSGTGSPTEFNAELLGSILTMTNDSDSFDFDGDGTDENARLRLTFVKQ
ncbi:MAG: hypothetical protein OEY63_03610 [Gemmatimonadota bacterium]|nr:hypothetical protein [Gemmatimonadota bacterium]MDH5804291.1 hypothetical protein [Gemmatimonadota bacterium]